MDTYFVNVVRNFQAAVDKHLADVSMPAAYHDDKLAEQRSVHILVVHTVASQEDNYLADNLVLEQ